MNWNFLPNEIIEIIMYNRKIKTSGYSATCKIQSIWRMYKTRVLIRRFTGLRYLQEFRIWNPNIREFIIRSRL